MGKQIAEARNTKGRTQSELAEKMDVSIETVNGWEQDAPVPEADNDGRLFHEDDMYTFLKGEFLKKNLLSAQTALPFAREKHEGQLRKPEKLEIPYVNHPLTMACHAVSMGLEDDALLAALLLHDVCEDCGVTPEELPVCREAQEIVRLVTKPKTGFSEKEYYEAILKMPKACLVKCIDRCHNVSGMARSFSLDRMERYIVETEEWYPQLLNTLKATPEYKNAAWLLSYQIKSVLLTAKRIK